MDIIEKKITVKDYLTKKECEKPINLKRLQGKSVFISSVKDCYNPFEEKYGITRKILEQLVNADCEVTISTKSNLILRNLELLKNFSRLKVAFSINTLSESFQKDMDHASTIQERLKTMEELYHAGIHTVLFMSPIRKRFLIMLVSITLNFCRNMSESIYRKTIPI